MTTGTAVTEASAASTARRGVVGTTTVKSTVQTATHDSPNCHGQSSPVGSRNSAAAMP